MKLDDFFTAAARIKESDRGAQALAIQCRSLKGKRQACIQDLDWNNYAKGINKHAAWAEFLKVGIVGSMILDIV